MIADALTLGKITTLALVNSANPCQIAMLILALITILTQNPEKRKKVLFVGFMFTFGVFIGYLFYSIVLIQLFQTFATTLKENSIYLRNGFATLAMIIGALKIKDYFMYQPGNLGSEMPMRLRPRAKIIIQKITSPLGAFFVGLIITLFLAPCTMAPLLVATETLSKLGLMGAIPWLLYFNFIAILPLLIITFFIYIGFATAENVAQWKEKNIKKLHLIAGILFFLIGLIMLLGII